MAEPFDLWVCPPAHSPPDQFHLQQAQRLEQQPRDQAGPALFAQHLEDRRVIGATLVHHLLEPGGGHVPLARRLRHAIGEAVGAIGLEPAAQRPVLRVVDRPFPHRHPGRGAFVLLRSHHRGHAVGIGLRQEREGGDAQQHATDREQQLVAAFAQDQQAEHGNAQQASARLGPDRDQQAGPCQTGREDLDRQAGGKDRSVAGEPVEERDDRDRHG